MRCEISFGCIVTSEGGDRESFYETPVDNAQRFAELALQAVQGRGFTVLSVGFKSIREALDFAGRAVGLGSSAEMAIAPVRTFLNNYSTGDYFAAIAHGNSTA